MQAARDILLLAAEDAFEFERWRESGPVIGDIDPEARAAEIAEFEALAIPMPSELDSLRRELEHAPKVREAIRNSAVALRRNGRATASSLVALGPQQLMHPHAMGAFGWHNSAMSAMSAMPSMAGMPGMAGMLDPRLAGLLGMDPRMVAQMAARAGQESTRIDEAELEPPPRTRRSRERKLADITVVASDGPLAAEVVGRDRGVRDGHDDPDDLDDDDDDDDLDDEVEVRPSARKREPERRPTPARGEPRRARPAPAREWDDDDDETDSMLAAPIARPAAADRNTMILGGIAAGLVIALLWVAFGGDRGATPVTPEQPLAQQQQPPPPPAPAPAPAPAIDPNTGLPYGQVPAPVAAAPEPATPTSSARSSSRGSGVRGSSGTPASTPTSTPAGGGVNPFADYKTPADPAGIGPAPQPQPQPADATPPVPAPAPTDGSAPAPAPAPTEQPKPVEPPKSDDTLLTKSKMTPAIREVVVSKVGDLQACYQDAIVGKPDLAGKVVFVISIDQDGVVTKVDIGKDDVGYGVAKCSAKKIKRWTLPSAGIPIIFDLPFDFKS